MKLISATGFAVLATSSVLAGKPWQEKKQAAAELAALKEFYPGYAELPWSKKQKVKAKFANYQKKQQEDKWVMTLAQFKWLDQRIYKLEKMSYDVERVINSLMNGQLPKGDGGKDGDVFADLIDKALNEFPELGEIDEKTRGEIIAFVMGKINDENFVSEAIAFVEGLDLGFDPMQMVHDLLAQFGPVEGKNGERKTRWDVPMYMSSHGYYGLPNVYDHQMYHGYEYGRNGAYGYGWHWW